MCSFLKAASGRFRGVPPVHAPLQPKIFSISCSFSQNLAKSYVGTPLEGWCPLLWEILHLPLPAVVHLSHFRSYLYILQQSWLVGAVATLRRMGTPLMVPVSSCRVWTSSWRIQNVNFSLPQLGPDAILMAHCSPAYFQWEFSMAVSMALSKWP